MNKLEYALGIITSAAVEEKYGKVNQNSEIDSHGYFFLSFLFSPNNFEFLSYLSHIFNFYFS